MLSACDSNMPQNTIEIKSNGTSHELSTLIPRLLRNVSTQSLTLQLTVGEIQNTYSGDDFTGNTWQIPLQLSPNQTHTLHLLWFSEQHLLLEQAGEFKTDSQDSTITPELEYISAGFARFDSDCDGFSNLDEFLNQTNPSIAQGTNASACSANPEPLALSDDQTPVLFRQHSTFAADGFSEAVTSYEQQIQITEHYKDGFVSFSAELTTDTGTQSPAETTTNAVIRFRRDRDGTKRMRFAMTNVSRTIPSTFPGGQCDPNPFFGFRSCGIPFDWQENHWYTVKVEQQSSTQWRGLIIDNETQMQFVIGTFESQADIRWAQAQNRIIDFRSLSAMECQQPQPPSTMRYRQGKVNGFRTISSYKVTPQICAQAGLGWSEGIRSVGFDADAQLEYELTLGRRKERLSKFKAMTTSIS